MYQMIINGRLEQIRIKQYLSSWCYDHKILKSLYIESKVQLPGQLLHNQHINYHNNKDTTPIYFPSKLYEFQIIKNDIVMGTEQREQEAEIPECALIILLKAPGEAVIQSLLSNCQVIMRNQAINYLFVERFESTDFPQNFAFNISKHIQSLTLKWCTFPSQTLNHLMQQINKCSTLRKIDLYCTTIQDVSSLTLSNKASLTHLNLCRTHMSRELSQSVCHQLTDLTQLKHLDLSDNDLSQVDMIHLSNKPNLSYLNCENTQMSTKLSKNIISQLIYITHLSELDLSYNTLTRCLSSSLPDPYPGLPQLEKLQLWSTELNTTDLTHLTHLIQTHKLPALNYLNLSYNHFCEIETDVEHLIKTCVNHHQRELKLRLGYNRLSEAFEKKWKHQCAGTKIELDF